MTKTVIVYGPKGCGKTRNAEHLRQYFGCTEINDDCDGRPMIVKDGYLHLCIVKPKLVKTNWVVMDYQSAMSMAAEK